MRTERQTQASRANGAKSSGPTTPEGKLASSRNATTHGMLSGTIVLEGESKDRFRALLAALHEELQPKTPIETSLVENMAVARWRQMRIWGMEKAGMQHEMRRQAEASQSKEDTATRSALAFRALSDDSRSLELINRYESRYDRQYLRAHRRLLELRDRPKPPPAQPAGESQRKTVFTKRTPEKRRTGQRNRYRKTKRSAKGDVPRSHQVEGLSASVASYRTKPRPVLRVSLKGAIRVHSRSFVAQNGVLSPRPQDLVEPLRKNSMEV